MYVIGKPLVAFAAFSTILLSGNLVSASAMFQLIDWAFLVVSPMRVMLWVPKAVLIVNVAVCVPTLLCL